MFLFSVFQLSDQNKFEENKNLANQKLDFQKVSK